MNTISSRRLLARTSRVRRIRRLSLYGPLGILGILLGGCGGSSPFTLPSMPNLAAEKAGFTKANVASEDVLPPRGLLAEEGTHFQAARAHEMQGELEEALKQYELAALHAPGDTRILVACARMLDRHERFDDAERKYREALRWDPSNPSIHNDLGLCQARAGRLGESLESLDQATRLSPREARYRNNMAKVLVEMGRHEDALQHLAAVHPIAVAHHNLGYFLEEKKETDLATRHFARAMELDPALANQNRIQIATRNANTSAVATTQWDARSRAYAAPRWANPGRNVQSLASSKPAPVAPQLASRPPSTWTSSDSRGIAPEDGIYPGEGPASYAAEAPIQGPVPRRLPVPD